MHYGEIKNCDIANGNGIRVTLFVSGCRNQCHNCFQPETWDFDYGEEFTVERERELLDMLEPSYIDGLTLLGGEPFEPENQRALLPLLQKLKSRYDNKTVWAYTGFTLEELADADCRGCCEVTKQLLELIDVLVDGRYIEEKRDISLRFRGSSNQRIIDMAETLKAGRIILWDE